MFQSFGRAYGSAPLPRPRRPPLDPGSGFRWGIAGYRSETYYYRNVSPQPQRLPNVLLLFRVEGC